MQFLPLYTQNTISIQATALKAKCFSKSSPTASDIPLKESRENLSSHGHTRLASRRSCLVQARIPSNSPGWLCSFLTFPAQISLHSKLSNKVILSQSSGCKKREHLQQKRCMLSSRLNPSTQCPETEQAVVLNKCGKFS